jgi:hypothetical protein
MGTRAELTWHSGGNKPFSFNIAGGLSVTLRDYPEGPGQPGRSITIQDGLDSPDTVEVFVSDLMEYIPPKASGKLSARRRLLIDRLGRIAPGEMFIQPMQEKDGQTYDLTLTHILPEEPDLANGSVDSA